jgi:hypothetical protein
VIVFINGPFGVGKTTVAKLLVQQMPHVMPTEVAGQILGDLAVPRG